MTYTDEQIAQVIHEMNRGLQYVQGDPCPSQPWQVEDEEIKANVIASVAFARAGATPRELHERWAEDKRAHGWTHGAVKDPEARTHPCLVPYGDLPEGQRLKDRLFAAVVKVMTEEEE
jgi:RyR domain